MSTVLMVIGADICSDYQSTIFYSIDWYDIKIKWKSRIGFDWFSVSVFSFGNNHVCNQILWNIIGNIQIIHMYIYTLGCPRMFKLVKWCQPQVFLVKYTQRMWENQKKSKNFDIFNPLKPFKVLVHTTSIAPTVNTGYQLKKHVLLMWCVSN